jgi:hypothetical protein
MQERQEQHEDAGWQALLGRFQQCNVVAHGDTSYLARYVMREILARDGCIRGDWKHD